MNRLRNLFACLCPALLLAAGLARAETVVWSDSFETNVPGRWSASGVWTIGAPTAGPAVNAAGYRTHSGANCAATQNYAYSQDVRLVCLRYNSTNSLLVPAADQAPRLRFWHWFNFVNALGFVEISTNGGAAWTQISPSYLNVNGGGVWSRPSIDLSAYAGQKVLIAFHFTSGCCGVGNALGWFVDDVEVVTGAASLNFPESFEAGAGDWAVDFGTWEVGRPTSGPYAAHTGTNCAGTVLAGNYAHNVDTRLISPSFLVPASGGATLRFWQWYSFVNAVGFLELNNGTTTSTAITNTTITTNVVATGLDTNRYQLFGAALPGYAAPLYWNQTIGGWTNATKVLGSVLDVFYGGFYFEAGYAPLAFLGQANADYRLDLITPLPQTAAPTNYPALQGLAWTSATGGVDSPVGYFGTNYSEVYTTNTTVTVSGGSWQTLPQTTIQSLGSATVASGGWLNTAVDLSAYAGQAVQIGFHFTSGGIYNTAAGWYVDDFTLIAAPTLRVPTNQVISFGQMRTNTLSATNTILPNSVFTFGLTLPSTNVVLGKTNGVLIWTNTAAPPGTYPVSVKVTDNSTPPFSVTNAFSVTVRPLPSQLVLSNALADGRSFKFSVKSTWTNLSWQIQATTNLNAAATNWVPLFTNKPGSGSLQFTDSLGTNFLQRFYRAVLP